MLQTLAATLKPWVIEDICTRRGVPALDLAEWPTTVESVRNEMSTGVLSHAERAARVLALVETLANRVRELAEISSGSDALLWMRTLIFQAMLMLASERDRSGFQELLVWASVGLRRYAGCAGEAAGGSVRLAGVAVGAAALHAGAGAARRADHALRRGGVAAGTDAGDRGRPAGGRDLDDGRGGGGVRADDVLLADAGQLGTDGAVTSVVTGRVAIRQHQ